MKRYEYKAYDLENEGEGTGWLNKLGKDGWLLCAILPTTGLCLFVREVIEDLANCECLTRISEPHSRVQECTTCGKQWHYNVRTDEYE